MKMKYEWIERHTEKASLFVRDELTAWLPKSCYTLLNDNEAEVMDGFEVKWKNEDGVVVKTEGINSSAGYEPRAIIITEQNKNELWEYI